MLDFDWNKQRIKNIIDLADCIELVVAFSNEEYNGRFTAANFIDIIESDILGDDNFLRGDNVDEYFVFFEDAMRLIKQRSSWLGESYPFRQKNNEVQFVSQTPGEQYLWYLFLLACSCHNQIPSLKHELRIQFENICKEAIRALFPDWADIFLFSQYSDDRKQLGISAKQAIPALAKKLNAKVKNIDTLPDTSQEYGIDLIIICSFGDKLEYPFFAFAQCTVSKDWWRKRDEAQACRGLSGVVSLDTAHTNFLLIPHFPRSTTTEWKNERQYPINCILCDRYRICRLLEKSSTFTYKKLPRATHDIFQKLQSYLPDNHI